MARQFTGSSPKSWIRTRNVNSIRSFNYVTCMAWVWLDSNVDSYCIGRQNGYHIFYNSGTGWRMEMKHVYNGSWVYGGYIGGNAKTQNWYHVCCVFDGTDMILYIYDHETKTRVKGVTNSPGPLGDSTTNRLWVGVRPTTNNPWVGRICEVKNFRDKVLTEEQIVQHRYLNHVGPNYVGVEPQNVSTYWPLYGRTLPEWPFDGSTASEMEVMESPPGPAPHAPVRPIAFESPISYQPTVEPVTNALPQAWQSYRSRRAS